MNELRVNIVGAGIAGLATHLTCRKAGVTVQHFERQPQLGPAGAGIVLWPNGVRVLQTLGLGERLAQIGCAPDRLVVRSKQDEILNEFPFIDLNRRLGAPCYVMTRTDLQAALLSAIGPDVLELGANCVRVEQTTTEAVAYFADGRREAADLLLGADGIHSTVRHAVGNLTPRYAGFATWVGLMANEGLVPANTAIDYLGDGQRCGLLPLTANRVYYSFAGAWEQGTPKPADGWKYFLDQQFSGWPLQVREAIARLGEEPTCHEVYDISTLPQWTTGRVALLGDAAHATTPTLGQAACEALEDAAWLGYCLTDLSGSIPDVLLRYELGRKDRAEHIVARAREESERMYATTPAVYRDLYRSIRVSSVSETLNMAERWLAQQPMENH